ALYGSVLIAYMLSGSIILLFGDQGSLVVLAVLLFIGTMSIFFVKYREEEEVKTRLPLRVNVREEIKSAFTLITKTKQIYNSLFLLALIQILILLLATITPGYASQVLGMDIEKFPLMFVTPAAIGMLIGAIFLVNRLHAVAKEKVVMLGLFLSFYSDITIWLAYFIERIYSRCEFIPSTYFSNYCCACHCCYRVYFRLS